MKTTAAIIALVLAKVTTALPDHTVQKFAVNRLLAEDFFKRLPGLPMPLCLVIIRSDVEQAVAANRLIEVGMVVCRKDLKGDAQALIEADRDALREALVNQQLASSASAGERVQVGDRISSTMLDSGERVCSVLVEITVRNY